jgi:Fe-S oxidoreductase
MLIEHVDAVVDLRRHQTLNADGPLGQGSEVLDHLRETDTVGGRQLSMRYNWASDLALRVLAPGDRCDVLLWLGEGGFDARSRRTLRTLVRILRIANVNVAILGDLEADCGDVARRLGDEAQFQRLAAMNIATLAGGDFGTLVTADPHDVSLGGAFSVTHATTYVWALVCAGRVKLAPVGGKVTYHDPCYLGRYTREFDAPRSLLNACGVELLEMPRHGAQSFCCGWGGGGAFTDVVSDERIPDLRVREAADTGASTIAVACPNCAVMLEGSTKATLKVSDVLEIVLTSAEAAAAAPTRRADSKVGQG